MSSLANTSPVQPPQCPHYAYPANDEIDLKELFAALWQGKWLIIMTTLLFSVGAISYALTAQEWWSSKATVSQPQLQGIASYQQAVKRYQPLFDVYQEDGTIIISNELNALIDPKLIFQQFIQAFNANGTKRRFMQTNPTFLALQAQLFNQDKKDAEELQRIYGVWFGKISAIEDKDKNSFTLSFQSIDKTSSLSLLNQYVQFVNQTINQRLNNDLISTLTAKYGELKQQNINLLQQAKLRLQVELERSQYALMIAEAATITKPVQNLGEQEIFAINIGSDALKAKVNALQSIKDLSVFEPRLAILQSKLNQFDLDVEKADAKRLVNSFYYLDEPELPLTRDQPKRALIVVFGAFIGGMLGAIIILVRFMFRRERP
ncbi:chain-length determining protein [Vibrio cholerae]|uniref:LPS O-antigen chain length determinant protein WzzB n=1 Tax=Vibrio cholerae TaxID=666 RepID=UPI00207E5091|nr:Wzz/FepE/Etk N-terminal domain-containing protein [Vibrio cholerae]EJL6289652.1 LPS O-antigen chain length determinant protein WzzB [Vibrio cholerae]EKF9070777.1 LPS O-antigen chain length determinant protein WzzB [Vibrio cholerae]EKF9802126.1 LPS O-antigen chain length determinant protein WzzB [Vibrio cholerae]MDV2403593.1 Wzz/FepE/Etk N-terminal domain-containing protein [Vibrio cholerae]GIB07122.1 chain-length determining protein [Vibrio cholerae]